MQKAKHSLLEQTLNIGSGFIIAYFAWKFIVAPLINHGWLAVEDSLYITIIFTVISFIRGYYWRRTFNLLHTRGIL